MIQRFLARSCGEQGEQRFSFFTRRSSMPRDGFTLTEMLVVIAIIAVLASLLFPVVSNAISRARAAQCVSNLRQIGVAISAYAVDHDGKLPWCDITGTNRWYLLLNPYVGRDIWDLRGSGSIFICPANYSSGSARYALWTDYGYLCNLQAMLPNDPDNGLPMVRITKRRILVADTRRSPTKEQISKSFLVYLGNTYIEKTRRPFGEPQDQERLHVHGNGVNALWTDFSVSFLPATEVNKKGSELSGGAYFGRPY